LQINPPLPSPVGHAIPRAEADEVQGPLHRGDPPLDQRHAIRGEREPNHTTASRITPRRVCCRLVSYSYQLAWNRLRKKVIDRRGQPECPHDPAAGVL
jgi:hypothetical protein